MKKILTLLMGLSLTTTAVNTIISCTIKSNPEQADGGGLDYQGDLKILNTITKHIADSFQQYATEKTLIDINDYSIPEFENLFSMVSAAKPFQKLDRNDQQVEPALSALVNGFLAVFDNLNRKIADDYSNYYPDSVPMATDQSDMKFTLNYIDINKLGTLTNVDTNGLKGVRLDFKLQLKVKFKSLEPGMPFTFQYAITNDGVRMKKILTAVTGAVSKAIVKFFNTNGGDIIVNQNSAYRNIYDNFDLNYAYDHSMLDTIVQNELSTALQADSGLGDIRDSITYAPDEEILALLNSIINPDTNGVTPSLPEDEKYIWVNTGYAPDKLTPENFLTYYGEKLNILTSTTGPKLQLGQFKVNLAKVLVAGIPLVGVVLNDGKPFYINIGITRDGMINKIKNFGRIIAAFYKYYQITWDIKRYTEGRIQLEPKLHEMMFDNPQTYTYKKIWSVLLKKFKEDPKNQTLPDLDKFWVSTFSNKDIVMGHDIPNLPERGIYLFHQDHYNLGFQFGVNSTTNNIYYTPWPVDKWNIAFKPYGSPM
ncbi:MULTISPECIES: hypothetical protein [Spiroplasma]|uniref:hypothetical protein n=1 Tax=Spiroplasma TaxID=2132 RepID=UPI0018DE8CCC|nr:MULTISPECIES: hypothetical protein [Spiroplasma]MBH8623465.1 hypothetical protein [Spiroplasma sp. hyd1]UNF62302.1 hypothetical protein MNU24_02235 [Spiroplasma poulsonii]